MLNPTDLLLFAQAVESGGFAPAARRLRIPKSTISKRVGELEAQLGARLLHRTSRSFTLTDVGREVYEHARAAQIEIESAEEAVRRRLAEPSGTVRLTASLPTIQFQLAAHLPALTTAFPKLRLVVHATDRFVDLVQEGFDIAIRSHFTLLPDSGLVQRRLRVQPIWLVAAPSYLEAHGIPEAPADLARHDGLLPTLGRSTWQLRCARDAAEAEVQPRCRFVSDESVTLLSAACAGLGIVPLPELICQADLQAGRLVHLLPDWIAGEVTTTILTPHRRSQLPGVRAVVDFLVRLGSTEAL